MGLASTGSLQHGFHLAKRFFGALSTSPPPASDAAWARAYLLPGEQAVWESLSAPDQRHAIEVARAVLQELETGAGGGVCTEDAVVAGLLHDCGKTASRLGTFSRVGATLWWAAADDDTARRWAAVGGVRGRLGRYRLHPELGGQLLQDVGARPLAVAWAKEHHLAANDWTVPGPVGAVLKRCDDD